MNTYHSNGFKSVKAESIAEAASIFAQRAARREFGPRGDVRTCNQGSYAQNGSCAEYSAFIGRTRGNETTGHNINFTVRVGGAN